MTTRIGTRRRQPRFSLPTGRATIEFDVPGTRRRYSAALVDLSAAGMSFTLEPNDGVRLEAGSGLERVVLRIGAAAEIRGEMLVMHFTPAEGGRTTCGALFYPAEDDDLVRLKAVVAGIEAVRKD